MLSIYELQRQSGQLDSQLTSIFAGPWDPNASPDSREAREPGAEVCWNSDPVYDPLGMTEMDDDERTVCHPQSAGFILYTNTDQASSLQVLSILLSK